METYVGSILNTFKIKRERRFVLFFNQIFTEYIWECEKAGYGPVLEKISRYSNALYCDSPMVGVLKKLPKTVLFNIALRHIWTNVGLLDDFEYARKGEIITLRTKGESFTRDIGGNRFMVGQYAGVLEGLCEHKVKCVEANQTKGSCEYKYVLGSSPKEETEHKSVEEYTALNKIQMKGRGGFTLKEALRKNILQLRENNRIYFRGMYLLNSENTLMHLLGNYGPMLEEFVPHISQKSFMEILGKPGNKRERLHLLKNLLQVMGWGIIDILTNDEVMKIQITYPPHGIQAEEDNWDFLVYTILGYLWLIDEGYGIDSKRYDSVTNTLFLVYSLA